LVATNTAAHQITSRDNVSTYFHVSRTNDGVVPFAWAQEAAKSLERRGVRAYFGQYKKTDHAISADMRDDFVHLLNRLLEHSTKYRIPRECGSSAPMSSARTGL